MPSNFINISYFFWIFYIVFMNNFVISKQNEKNRSNPIVHKFSTKFVENKRDSPSGTIDFAPYPIIQKMAPNGSHFHGNQNYLIT